MSRDFQAVNREIDDLLAAEADAEQVLALAGRLKSESNFGAARRLLERARQRLPGNPELARQLIVCTCRDEDQPATGRYARAQALLEELHLRDPERAEAETLRLGGAVYKQLWEHKGLLEHLYESLALFLAGHRKDKLGGLGHGGINAAFIYDVLASRARVVARRNGLPPRVADAFARRARALRRELARLLPPLAGERPELLKDYGFVATVAEVWYGLEDWEQAAEWLARAGALGAAEWELQATFRQLAGIARQHGHPPPRDGDRQWHRAWSVLTGLLGESRTRSALGCYRGKVGLALSGGGLRASLFHLGVLARLAEMDVLRSVEVLSTVSGGSIVGAHYYLEVQKLLQTRPDGDIGRQDYIDLVERVRGAFLAGVRENLRMRALSDLRANLRMILQDSYTISHRLGELYDRVFYARVADGHDRSMRRMRELIVRPVDEGEDFKPKLCNWRRRAKVPVLLLNATSLNTGHVWQFTASWMGEPPGLLGEEVDKNQRLRRLYYDQAPEDDQRRYPLGYAVAASAGVPGLFDPLVIDKLYPERTVRLVDGGVHDNQGVAGLLDQGCNLILCSDAAGQMDDENDPAQGRVGVLMRSSSIMMNRVREAEYEGLRTRVDSRALQGLFFIHLKSGLVTAPVDWRGCQDPTPRTEPERLTPYGVACDLQQLLAELRTDLDSFTEVEAESLMLSGYLMTEHQFRVLQAHHEKQGEVGRWGDYDIDASRGSWPFLRLAPLLGCPETDPDPRRADLKRQLAVGRSLFFRIWRLDEGLHRLALGLGGAGMVLLLALILLLRDAPLTQGPVTMGAVVLAAAGLAASMALPLWRWLSPREMGRSYLRKIAVGVLGWVAGNLHLWFAERRLQERGSVKRLLGDRN